MESVTYDTKISVFPDGTMQFYKSSRRYHRMGDDEKEMKLLFDQSYADSLGVPLWVLEAMSASDLHDGSSVQRKELDNMKRAVQKVYQIAKSNPFDYFVTFTFNPQLVNSFDYDCCVDVLRRWMDYQRKRGIRWLIVPEQHKSGRYHFHALVSGQLILVPAVNPHTGAVLFDRSGRMIYNVGNFDWGYTTATEISDPKRAASYIAKYLAKDISVPKGRKRYWASNGLARPDEKLVLMSDMDFIKLIGNSRYFKEIQNDWGKFWFCETQNT